ncbi:MAG TPA: choice-of-anchor Q domain-containing protein [Candidatus Binatia bacterium]|jgi:hypothetical protein|nr:choice-of-anchor Q domain-containing protein [Candidatus Binatia bacterium]
MRTGAWLGVVLFGLVSSLTSATTRYVDSTNPNPAPPYTSWSTAATNIQDAIDAASPGEQVLVTNGVYQSGGRPAPDGFMTVVVVTNQLTLQSVNGASVTAIDGGQSMRCVYLTNGAMLTGFTVSKGKNLSGLGGGVCCGSFSNEVVASCLVLSNSASSGGGINRGTVSNCVIAWNTSSGSGGGAESCLLSNCILSNNTAGLFGGGASGGISALNNCVVVGNISMYNAGGVYGSILNNCLVLSNFCRSVGFAGGTYECIMNNCTICGNSAPAVDMLSGGIVPQANNCIIYYNIPAGAGANFTPGATLHNCCTTPLPGGKGNITNAPLFVNLPGGNFHLASSSPCINSGNNAYVTTATDLDANPRVVGGTVDIGAYEFQNPASIISYAWLLQYGLPMDGSADFMDSDEDGMNNWQEWICGTNPTNAASVLKMLAPQPGSASAAVTWLSVTNRNYFLQRAADLSAQPAFLTVATNIPGRLGNTTYTDTNAAGTGPFFYRVGVHQ